MTKSLLLIGLMIIAGCATFNKNNYRDCPIDDVHQVIILQPINDEYYGWNTYVTYNCDGQLFVDTLQGKYTLEYLKSKQSNDHP